ncbi:MAG: aspartate carbamoyltransferase [Simkaniaceae bacterium]|nr:aspartate carbamoyltransferase [Simkaniaceae bacterium]
MIKETDIISIADLSRDEIETILSLAQKIKEGKVSPSLKGKILATLFFEASTRTRLSFEAAMHKLGGSVIGFSEPKKTSAEKGETLADAIRVVSSYADALVIRHPLEGAARLSADVADIPVINAGDGAREHPTQTLLDLFSIKECQGKLNDLKIACVGDLRHGRTAHSLAIASGLFNMRLFFVAPQSLTIPAHITHQLKVRGVKYSFHTTIEEVLPKIDILYMIRTQKERFEDGKEYAKYKKAYCVTPELLKEAKKNLRILHPLPRVCEIDSRIDSTPYAYYFEQAANGLYVRQAVLSLIMGGVSSD